MNNIKLIFCFLYSRILSILELIWVLNQIKDYVIYYINVIPVKDMWKYMHTYIIEEILIIWKYTYYLRKCFLQVATMNSSIRCSSLTTLKIVPIISISCVSIWTETKKYAVKLSKVQRTWQIIGEPMEYTLWSVPIAMLEVRISTQWWFIW